MSAGTWTRLARWSCTAALVGLQAWGPPGDTALAAAARFPVRLGQQSGGSRITVRLPAAEAFTLTQKEGHIILHVAGASLPRTPLGVAPGVSGVAIAGTFLRFDVGKSRHVQAIHEGRDLVLEVVEVPPVGYSSSAAEPSGVLPGLPVPLVAVIEGQRPRPSRIRPSGPDGGLSREVPEPPANAPPAPVETANPIEAASLRAGMADSTDGVVKGRGLFLPFPRGVGAAAFNRGADTLIVFDAARPLDLSDVLREPLGVGASIQVLPEATLLTLPKRVARQLALQRLPAGWLVLEADAVPGPATIDPVLDKADLRLPVAAPGRSVVIPDPGTGENLLVGTLKTGAEGFRRTRHGQGYIIVETALGVAIEPLSDRIEMRATRDAFLLSGVDPQSLALPLGGEDAQEKPDSSGGRILAFRSGPRDTLYRRYKEAIAAAAAAPAGSRFNERMMAAQDALALGDGTQASILAQVGVADDARQMCVRLTRIVRLAAKVLEQMPQEDNCPDDPAYIDSPEVALWRGVAMAQKDPHSSEAARLLAANLALLQSYPKPLAAILLPVAAEALVQGGTDAQAALLDPLSTDGSLASAKALLAERRGQNSAAERAFKALNRILDMRVADLSLEQSIFMRLRKGELTPRGAADLLNEHLLDARIAGRELSARYRLVDLRMLAGQWPEALSLLRETSFIFPGEQDAIRIRAGEVLKRLAASPPGGSGADSFKTAALIEANVDLVPQGSDGARLSRYLVDRLMALDLPERAAPIVTRMLAAAPPGPDKASLGTRLASMDLQQNDPVAAQQALSASEEADLPVDLIEQRRMLLARALAAEGHADEALAAIKGLTSAPALDLKASLLMSLRQWPEASNMLSLLVARAVPATGPLDRGQQGLLLRLASAASRAGDASRQAQVRDAVRGRVGDPDQAALFQLLTSGSDVAAGSDANANLAALGRVAAGVEALGR